MVCTQNEEWGVILRACVRAQGEEANVFVKSSGGGLERMNDDGGACDRLFLVASLPDLVCLDLLEHDRIPMHTVAYSLQYVV